MLCMQKPMPPTIPALYSAIPHYSAHDMIHRDLVTGLLMHQATAVSSHLRPLRGIVQVDEIHQLLIFDYEKRALQDCFKHCRHILEGDQVRSLLLYQENNALRRYRVIIVGIGCSAGGSTQAVLGVSVAQSGSTVASAKTHVWSDDAS